MWQEKWLGQTAWNNNNAESINHQLKLTDDWKPQRLTDLVDHLRDAVNLQYSSLRRASLGKETYSWCHNSLSTMCPLSSGMVWHKANGTSSSKLS